MKQILQNLKTGALKVANVPQPAVIPGHLLIQSRCSLISAGTERMLVSFAKSSLLGKAEQQPDKVKQVIEKIKTDGLPQTDVKEIRIFSSDELKQELMRIELCLI